VPATRFSLPSDLGDYQLLGEIGRGGMGVVYRAFDRRRQEVVALKTLQGMDPRLLYRFKQEFRALAGVSHPNLVSLHRLVAEGEVCWFTMELVEGVDFCSYVRGPVPVVPSTRAGASLDDTSPPLSPLPEVPALSPEQYARLRASLGQLARGLQALHGAGKLHRDLKPANVLVTGEGRTVILDFGLAAQLDASGRHASTVMVVGTLPYMAPEQADAAALTPAADGYSVGVMLYEVLVGRTPFDGTPHQILIDKQRLDPPAPSTLVAGVPEDLDRLCVDLLRRRPEERPGGEEVLARLLPDSGQPTALPQEARRSLFVGRVREMDTLTQAFADLRRGQTVVVHIRGRSGVGKSTLIQHFLQDARAQDAVVLEGRCYEQESVPYKAFDSLVDGLSRYLARLSRHEAEALLPRDVASLVHVFPVLRQAAALAQAPRREGTLDPRELRRRAFASLRELLARLGDRRPLVLSIDDLQWGDVDSASLLTGLLLPPDPPLLLLLASYRSEEMGRSPFLQAFLSEKRSDPNTHVIELSGLSEEEAGELARELMREHSDEEDDTARAELIARESHGSPLFVQELVQFLSTAGTRTIHAAIIDSELLDEVLWQRIGRLAGPARQLMEVVAVAGRPLHEEEAARAAGHAAVDRAILAQLRAERLLRGTGASSGEEVETYHDRVRETILHHLAADVKREHHHRLAEVLAVRPGVEPELLAGHLHGAGKEREAGQYYERAADRATAALAFDKAADYYRLALTLSAPDRAGELRLRTLLATALMSAGHGAEAGGEFLAASRLTTGLEALALKREGALQYILAGHKEEGIAVLHEVVEAVGLPWPRTPRRIVWGILLRRLWLRIRGLGFRERRAEDIPALMEARLDTLRGASRCLAPSSPMLARYFQTRGLHLALQAGEVSRVAEFFLLEIGHESVAGGKPTRRIRKLWERVEEFAARFNEPPFRAAMTVTRGFEGYLRGEWVKASRNLDEGERILREEHLGHAWDVALCHTIGLAALVYQGEFALLQQRGPAALLEARERGDRHTTRELSLVIMPMVHLAADRPEEAERGITDAFDPASEPGFNTPHYLWMLGSMWTTLYRGDAARARAIVEARWHDYSGSLLRYMQKVRIDLHTFRASSWLLLGEEGTIERDLRAIEKEHMPWSDAIAQLLRASLLSLRGNREEAGRRLEALIPRFEGLDMRLYAASVRRRLGELRSDARLIEEADRWMRGQKIRNTARMAGVFAPGFRG
jgi:serine/threonine protein kinase